MPIFTFGVPESIPIPELILIPKSILQPIPTRFDSGQIPENFGMMQKTSLTEHLDVLHFFLSHIGESPPN